MIKDKFQPRARICSRCTYAEEQNNLTQDALTIKHEILEKIARKYLKVLSKIGVEAEKQK